MKPIIITNFKTYEQATGDKAAILAKIHDKVASESGAAIMVAAQNADLHRVSEAVSIPVLAQHADPVEYGSNTGHDLPECLAGNGAWGTLINHSEDRMPADGIKKAIERCRQAGLKAVVCAESVEKASEIINSGPDYLAFEDPVLIGTGRSVSRHSPDSVREFAAMVSGYNKNAASNVVPLCGAGVSSAGDVRKSMGFGMRGVLLASAIVKSDDPEKLLSEMASASPS